MATYKPPTKGTYKPPGRAAVGRQFGQAGSLRPDTETGFGRRDEVTGMQNDQNRESSLYNRIFRQQSRASRKGDISAGIGALETMGAARAAGFSVGGIKSYEDNRDFAAGTLDSINDQTAMMEGQQGGGQWQDDGQGGSSFVERTAAPVSGATGVPEVPGMQKPPEASMADSFQEEVVAATGGKLGSRRDSDGSVFERITGVNPNKDPNMVTRPDGDTEIFDQPYTAVGTNLIGRGVPVTEDSPSPSPSSSLADQFAKDFPRTSQLIGAFEQRDAVPVTTPGYDPSTDDDLVRFKADEKKYGREEAMRRAQARNSKP